MKVFKKSPEGVILPAITLVCIVLLAIRPEIYLKSSFEGIKLWALTVLPSLLPFFFLTSLTSATGVIEKFSRKLEKPMRKIFRCGGICSYAFIMSILSGYPVGAKMISDLRKNGAISPSEATRMSTFCSTSGPLFIIGSVGTGMFNDKRAGYSIIAAHILSAVICGIIFRFYGENDSPKSFIPNRKLSENILYDCVYSSVISVALVGGFVCVFYVFADVMINLKISLPAEYLISLFLKDERASKGFVCGLIECTRGAKTLSAIGVSPLSGSLACADISFGGISVIAQSSAFLKSAKVKTSVFMLSKTLQTIISFLLCLLICQFVF
ncbi:MAG: hypothetical protein J5836_00065 [Clostridia bacterium]|nr:hypothetical protein [Clostridia bacterium]